MTILEMFEKVNIIIGRGLPEANAHQRTTLDVNQRTPFAGAQPIERRVFFNYLNDSINEIGGLYGDIPKTVFKDNIISADIVPVSALTDDLVIMPLYHNAIVDNILFLCGMGDSYKGEFVRKTKEAYLHYWNIISKGKHVKRNRW